MSTRHCVDCGQQLSSDAAACTACGRPTKDPSSLRPAGKVLLVAIPVLVTAASFPLAVLEFREARIWKRHEFVANEMKQLRSNASVALVFKMLDWNSRSYRLDPGKNDSVLVTDATLLGALVPHTLTDGVFTETEVQLRDHFDTFFDELGRLSPLVATGALRMDDLSPYLGYYLAILGDPESGRKTPELVRMIWRYLDCYHFEGAQDLLRRSGYDITVPTTPGCN